MNTCTTNNYLFINTSDKNDGLQKYKKKKEYYKHLYFYLYFIHF